MKPAKPHDLSSPSGRGRDPAAPSNAAYETALTAGDFVEAERVAREGLAATAALPWRRRLAKALALQARHPEVLEVAEAGLVLHPEDPALLERAQNAARALRQPHVAMTYLERLAALRPADARLRFLMGGIHLKAFRGKAALENFEAAIRLGMPRIKVLPDLALAAERARHFDEAVAHWEDLAQEGLVTEGAFQEAMERLAYLSRLERPEVGTVDQLFALASTEDGKAVSLATEAGDIAAWRRSDSDVAVLLFAGLPWMMGAAPPANRSPLDRLGVNVLAFTDVTQRLCLKGLPSLGPDFETTIARLRALLETWGVRHIYVLGYSAAGRTALRYAVEVKAERLLLVAGWLDIPPDYTVMLGEHLKSTLGLQQMEPRSYLEGPGAGLQVTMTYGAESPRDVWQARLLEGLPNVTPLPLPGVSDHILTGLPVHAELVAELVTPPGQEPPAMADD